MRRFLVGLTALALVGLAQAPVLAQDSAEGLDEGLSCVEEHFFEQVRRRLPRWSIPLDAFDEPETVFAAALGSAFGMTFGSVDEAWDAVRSDAAAAGAVLADFEQDLEAAVGEVNEDQALLARGVAACMRGDLESIVDGLIEAGLAEEQAECAAAANPDGLAFALAEVAITGTGKPVDSIAAAYPLRDRDGSAIDVLARCEDGAFEEPTPAMLAVREVLEAADYSPGPEWGWEQSACLVLGGGGGDLNDRERLLDLIERCATAGSDGFDPLGELAANPNADLPCELVLDSAEDRAWVAEQIATENWSSLEAFLAAKCEEGVDGLEGFDDFLDVVGTLGVPDGWGAIESYCVVNGLSGTEDAAAGHTAVTAMLEAGPPFVVTAEMAPYLEFIVGFCSPGSTSESFVRNHFSDLAVGEMSGGPISDGDLRCFVQPLVDSSEELEAVASRLLAGGSIADELAAVDLDTALGCIDMAALYAPAFAQGGVSASEASCVASALTGSQFYRDALATALAGGTPGFAVNAEIEAAAQSCGVDIASLAPPETDE